MAPKKKTKQKGVQELPVQEKNSNQQRKEDPPEEKQQKQVPVVQKPKVNQSKKPEAEEKPDQSSKTKIKIEDDENLSQAEILRRRKLRFQTMGTDVTGEEAEKKKLQRLSKFGGDIPLSKEEMDKRKVKFGLKQPQEDTQILQKRKNKFGGEGESKPDPKTIQERKKKFGGNDVSLNDEIEKGKNKTSKSKNFKESKSKGKFRKQNRNNFNRLKYRPREHSRGHSNKPMKKFKR